MDPLILFILAGSGGLSSNSVIILMMPSQRSTLFVFDTDNDVEADDELCFSKVELLWAITLLDTVKNVFCWDNVVADVVVEWKSLISWKFFVDSNFFAQLMSELLVAVCFWYWILCSDDLFVETLCILARIDCMESMPEREQYLVRNDVRTLDSSMECNQQLLWWSKHKMLVTRKKVNTQMYDENRGESTQNPHGKSKTKAKL